MAETENIGIRYKERDERMKDTKSQKIDMLNGAILGKIILFSIPIMLSGILQLLFNAADVMVVGKWAGKLALAAVGSNGSLINLFTNLFMGLSVGASVQVSMYYGARRYDNVSKTVHTAVLVSVLSGLFLTLIGLFFAVPMLKMMGTPNDVIYLSALYLRIYFLGMPFMLLYNFGSAILRSVGDTGRPLLYLTIAGIINLILNIIFVVLFQMSVAGVAVATIISQFVSAVLIITRLLKEDSCIRLEWKKLRIHPEILLKIVKIGLPAGIQGMVFSFSNVIIQSSVNSFGSVVMAGNTAASNIEGFIYTSMNSIYQACITFTSQNLGAGKYSRIPKILLNCVGLVLAVGIVFGSIVLFFGRQIMGLYASEQEVIAFGVLRLQVILRFYFLCGLMEVLVGSIRGLGHSVLPMVVSILGACGTRILWIFTVFRWVGTLESLYVSYPITWALTAGIHLICYFLIRRKLPKKDRTPALA